MVGRSGLERQYDKQLRGKVNVTRYEVDKLGRVLGQAQSDPAEPGANLVTSIDARVQRIAEYQLNEAMKEARKQHDRNTGRNYEADSGAVVVMEARTGRVVAMASNPTYDPNSWVGGISAKDYAALTGTKSNYPLLNRAIQGQSAPGSIFKVIPTAAAIKAGYSFEGPYNCSSSYSIGGQVFKNFESQNHGPISLGRALEVSCDTVFYALSHEEWKRDGGNKPKKNAHDWFYKTAHQFGLGKETGIDLPNEVTGRVPDRQWKADYWKANKDAWCKYGKKGGSYAEQIAYENCLEGNRLRAGDSVNYSIGQGDTLVTPIQMATIYAAISNGGTLYDPSVGKAVISPDGKTVTEIKPQAHGKLPTSKKTLKQIDEALEGVATRGTAAWRFGGWPQDKIPMHAKTGTAEVYGKQTTSWFATYTKDYAIVMTISQGGTGSGASGPAVRNIYNALYGVSEDGEIDSKKALLPTPQKTLPRSARTAPSPRRRPPRTSPSSSAPPRPRTPRPRPAGRRPRRPAAGGHHPVPGEHQPRHPPQATARRRPGRGGGHPRGRARRPRARAPGEDGVMTGGVNSFQVSGYGPERAAAGPGCSPATASPAGWTGRYCSRRSPCPCWARSWSTRPPATAPSSTRATRTTSWSGTG